MLRILDANVCALNASCHAQGIRKAVHRFITDHGASRYADKMAAALEFEPVAFAGGDIKKDYQQVEVHRSTPSGEQLHVFGQKC